MFRIIEVTTFNDGTKPSQGIYSYEDDNEAIANFYTKFGGMMKLDKVQTEMCMVITEQGEILKRSEADGSFKYYRDYYMKGTQTKAEE